MTLLILFITEFSVLFELNLAVNVYAANKGYTTILSNFSHSAVTLNLAYNKINNVPHGVLQNYASLRILYLDHNIISLVSKTAFQGLLHLEKIQMERNNSIANGKREKARE